MSINDNKYKYKDKYEKYKYKYNLLKNTNNALVGGGPEDGGTEVDKDTISFAVGLSGSVKVFKEFDEYKYFYQVKAAYLETGKYYYCKLSYEDTPDIHKIIEDYEETKNYNGKKIQATPVSHEGYMLRDDISIAHLDMTELAANPLAISLIKEYLTTNKNLLQPDSTNDRKFWENLSLNSNAIDLLNANIANINWPMLAKNPNAMHLLETHYNTWYTIGQWVDKTWKHIIQHPNALLLLLKTYNNSVHVTTNIDMLWANPNMLFIEKQLSSNLQLVKTDKNNYNLNWSRLASNPNIINIITHKNYVLDDIDDSNNLVMDNIYKNPKAIGYVINRQPPNDTFVYSWICALSVNPDPIAIKILNDNHILFDSRIWYRLSTNPGAITLLNDNPDNIDWLALAQNPNSDAFDLGIEKWNKIFNEDPTRDQNDAMVLSQRLSRNQIIFEIIT